MCELTLRNGLVVTPSGVVRGGIAIDGGIITQIGPDVSLPRGDRDIDVDGKVLFPGLVDPHVHMGVPDSTREKMESDFQTESRDAAAGGVTTMITMTLFGEQSRLEVADMSLEAGDRFSQVDYRLTSVITKR